MKPLTNENLNLKDRITRVLIGGILAMTPLYIPENTAIFTAAVFAAIYPLLTGLTAIDPILNSLSNIEWKSNAIKKVFQTTPHVIK